LLIYFLHLSIVFSVDTAARGNYHSRRSLFGVVDCWVVCCRVSEHLAGTKHLVPRITAGSIFTGGNRSTIVDLFPSSVNCFLCRYRSLGQLSLSPILCLVLLIVGLCVAESRCRVSEQLAVTIKPLKGLLFLQHVSVNVQSGRPYGQHPFCVEGEYSVLRRLFLSRWSRILRPNDI